MALNYNSFSQYVANAAAAVQSSASNLVDFTTGSIERAFLEAYAGGALWIQYLISKVLLLTRLATSTGADVDSFGADFGFSRLAASYSVGVLTVSRYSTTNPAIIMPGATVRTLDGSASFVVSTDTTNANWSTASLGYVLPAATTSINVPVIATVAGTAGNVQAGTITVLTQAIPGVDYCNNASLTVGGVNAETDAAFQARFALWVNTRSLATEAAVGYAISQVQPGLTYTIQENIAGGVYTPGNFIVTVDDGTGYPPSGLLTNIYAAVNSYRPLGSTFGVFAPSVLTPNVALTITSAPSYTHSAVVVVVTAAIQAYVNSLPMGTTLALTRLAQVAYDSYPGAVINVTAVTLNSATNDIVATPQQVVKLGTLTVT